MAFSFSIRITGIARLGGLLLLVLALAGQVSSGALALPKESAANPAVALNAAMILCLAGNHPDKHGLPPIHRHLPDPAIAAENHHCAPHAAILDGDRALQPPPASVAFWCGLPEARGPPTRYAAAAYPTGPPTRLT